MEVDDYSARLREEIEFHQDCLDVHALTAIFHSRADTYVKPMLLEAGTQNPHESIADGLRESACRPGASLPALCERRSGELRHASGGGASVAGFGCDEFANRMHRHR